MVNSKHYMRCGKNRTDDNAGHRHRRARELDPTMAPDKIGNDERSAVFHVDRALGDLRRGGMVVLADAAGMGGFMLSPEFLTVDRLATIEQAAGGAKDLPPTLVLTRQRARALAIEIGAGGVVALPLDRPLDAEHIRDLADPTARGDTVRADAGALHAVPAVALDGAAIDLVKLASLLPAALIHRLDRGLTGDAEGLRRWAEDRDLTLVTAAEIESYRRVAMATLTPVSSARVPLADAPETRIVAFRPLSGGVEHLAIVIGSPAADSPVLVRLHSQCFTGDLLESLRCDCGEQLRGAVRACAQAGKGIVLYLAQEGRGIGLVNKLRAYQLQDQGLDTFEANEQLGFDADERHYQVAAEMLRQLGHRRIRLLTNNPDKIAALARFGIAVVERVPHNFPANEHNRRYLATKARRGGHML